MRLTFELLAKGVHFDWCSTAGLSDPDRGGKSGGIPRHEDASCVAGR